MTATQHLTKAPRMGIYWLELECLTGLLAGITVGEVVYADERRGSSGFKLGQEFRSITGDLRRVSLIVAVDTVERADLAKAIKRTREAWKVGG